MQSINFNSGFIDWFHNAKKPPKNKINKAAQEAIPKNLPIPIVSPAVTPVIPVPPPVIETPLDLPLPVIEIPEIIAEMVPAIEVPTEIPVVPLVERSITVIETASTVTTASVAQRILAKLTLRNFAYLLLVASAVACVAYIVYKWKFSQKTSVPIAEIPEVVEKVPEVQETPVIEQQDVEYQKATPIAKSSWSDKGGVMQGVAAGLAAVFATALFTKKSSNHADQQSPPTNRDGSESVRRCFVGNEQSPPPIAPNVLLGQTSNRALTKQELAQSGAAVNESALLQQQKKVEDLALELYGIELLEPQLRTDLKSRKIEQRDDENESTQTKRDLEQLQRGIQRAYSEQKGVLSTLNVNAGARNSPTLRGSSTNSCIASSIRFNSRVGEFPKSSSENSSTQGSPPTISKVEFQPNNSALRNLPSRSPEELAQVETDLRELSQRAQVDAVFLESMARSPSGPTSFNERYPGSDSPSPNSRGVIPIIKDGLEIQPRTPSQAQVLNDNITSQEIIKRLQAIQTANIAVKSLSPAKNGSINALDFLDQANLAGMRSSSSPYRNK